MELFNMVLLGVIIAIIFYEITDTSPGGIVVPGLLVMYFDQPIRILYTLIIAFISYLICKLLSKKILIFGKRRFVLLIIISVLLNALLTLILSLFNIGVSITYSLIIGYTISGLIANDFYKQGVIKTLPGLIICTGILELVNLIK